MSLFFYSFEDRLPVESNRGGKHHKIVQNYLAFKSPGPATGSSLLQVIRLPARLNNEQTALLLGHQPHDIPALVKAGLLKPLGGGSKNCVKYFAAVEVEELCRDRKWLDRATRATSRRKGRSVEIASTHA